MHRRSRYLQTFDFRRYVQHLNETVSERSDFRISRSLCVRMHRSMLDLWHWNLLEVKMLMSYFGAIKNVNILHNVQAQNRHNHHTAKQRRGDRLHHGCDGGHLQSVDVLAEIEPFFGYTACTWFDEIYLFCDMMCVFVHLGCTNLHIFIMLRGEWEI